MLMQSLNVRDQTLALLPERALHWRERDCLVVADLRIATPNSAQDPIAAVDELEGDLARLDEALRTTQSRQLVVLGDLIPPNTMPSLDAIDRFAAWRVATRAEIVLVRSHEAPVQRDFVTSFHIQSVALPLEWGPLLLAAAPALSRDAYTLSGALAPVIDVVDENVSRTLPCFHFGPRIGLLPAFSKAARSTRMYREEPDRVFTIDGPHVDPF